MCRYLFCSHLFTLRSLLSGKCKCIAAIYAGEVLLRMDKLNYLKSSLVCTYSIAIFRRAAHGWGSGRCQGQDSSGIEFRHYILLSDAIPFHTCFDQAWSHILEHLNLPKTMTCPCSEIETRITALGSGLRMTHRHRPTWRRVK